MWTFMRLPIADVLHRGTVLALVGMSAYGIFLSGAVHHETLEKGKVKRYISQLHDGVKLADPYDCSQLMAQREAALQKDKEEAEKEEALVKAAQSSIPNSSYR